MIDLRKLIEEKIETKYYLSDEHLFIVGAHINNEEKEKKLVRCIKKLREFNIPIVLSTHNYIRSEIVELVDYFINDEKNELLMFDRFMEFNINSLRWVDGGNYIINSYVNFHHDFAAITIIKNSIILAKKLGKTKIHYFDYDCIIDVKQYFETFLHDIEFYDVVFGFLFSMNIDIAEKIFVNDVTTLENHFKRNDWRFEDFLINGIKKYSNKYLPSRYIDNKKLINTEAAWLRAGINRNGAYFQTYLCVDSEDNLYFSLISSTKNCNTPTSSLIYSNVGIAKNDFLLEIKYNSFNLFHNLKVGHYDLIFLGKYIKDTRVIVNYMGVKIFDELLNKNLDEYRKMNFIIFNKKN